MLQISKYKYFKTKLAVSLLYCFQFHTYSRTKWGSLTRNSIDYALLTDIWRLQYAPTIIKLLSPAVTLYQQLGLLQNDKTEPKHRCLMPKDRTIYHSLHVATYYSPILSLNTIVWAFTQTFFKSNKVRRHCLPHVPKINIQSKAYGHDKVTTADNMATPISWRL